ncbi:MAG: hypothetical protein JRC86_08980 [Deltaproteobacteria bacterium]|nr:hypothetical protein [Deltaproteobacteria bacterium]
MTHKKHRQRKPNRAPTPDKAERNGSDSKVRRKKKKDVDRSDDASGYLPSSE